MKPRRFFSNKKNSSGLIEIESDELFHLRKVLRHRAGDPIEVFNGRGRLFIGKIESVNSKVALVKIEKEVITEKPQTSITIAPSLLKRKPMNLLIEKLTEIGVDEIKPLIFSRTELKFDNTSADRWKKMAVESLKVNDRLWPTKISDPCYPEDLIADTKNIPVKILLDIQGEKVNFSKSGPFICVVGPPGDFEEEERELFKKGGFIPVNINDAVMKVETASFSIASILKYLSRWG